MVSTKVKVKQGTVVGGQSILPNGTPYFFFQGIPYGVPPLGELRFKAPVPLARFSKSEIDCTKEGNVSIQPEESKVIGSEDCLFLNVYIPDNKADQLLPVMVFIHGGDFLFGSGNRDFYNPLYLMQEDVVVVTINYRLGILGFLSLPEANIPGNAGLKDQRLALQWIQENISQFNGDPNNVTLFGESTGSACVHLHVLSENSRKLFHKAIMQSGSGNLQWAIEDKASDKTKNFVQSLGCTSDDPFEIAKFLRNFSDLTEFIKPFIAEATVDTVTSGFLVPSKPVIEKVCTEAVVTRAPLESMNDENSFDIPVMMGYNSAEGITALPGAMKFLEYFDKDFRKLIPKDFNLQPEDPRSTVLANSMKNFYFKGAKLDTKTLDNFSDLLGDLYFIVGSNEAAEIHSRKQHRSPLFFYRFDYDGQLNLYKTIVQMTNIKGASHADELFYIFQAKLSQEQKPWGEKAKQMVLTLCKLWTNFAKCGNPTPVDCLWEPVKKIGDKDSFTLNAFIIDEQQKMLENPNAERMAFWRNAKETYGKNASQL